ncbi:unnamed protein product [Peniophora sp. CBMAI 1063]|nr:unnamed protein product [Peniophora sp. CBMAI 1063]
MPKRPLEDIEDATTAAGSSKRARFDPSAPQVREYNHAEDTQLERSAKSKGKQRATDDMDVDDDEDGAEHTDAMGTDDEAELEKEVRESIRQRGNRPTASAKYGVIDKVEMYQFMCHQHLTFNFGPRINFIIGHNGSGKSAVLSAITIGLGGKANSTGRGSGLKAFIREGQNAAEVTIHIKNQGEEAYRHDVYGDSIVITRKFTRDGSSSYAIKSKSGKKISGKREELSAICDHMSIHVDNPLNVLTQDASRQFLNSANASDKYKFFLQGTLLAQLSDEYQICDDNLSRMSHILGAKRGAVPDLDSAHKDAEQRLKEAKAARDHRNRIDDLKKELVWSTVRAKEMEVEAQVEVVSKSERRVEKLQGKVDGAQRAVDAATALVMEKERAHNELGSREGLDAQVTALKAKISTQKRALGELKIEEANVNTEVQSIRSEIETLKEQRRVELAKSATRVEGEHEALLHHLEEAKAELERAGAARQAADDRVAETRRERDGVQTAIQQNEHDVRQADAARIGAHQQRLTAEESAQDNLAAFGRNMHHVLDAIQEARWHGETPVGPIGRYVKLRDGQWAGVLRVQIGRLMSAFAITDLRDRDTLSQILRRFGNEDIPIIVAGIDLFDYSRGEPDERYLTILRALEIDNEYVKRVLVDRAHIERLMLFRERKEADAVLKAHRSGVALSQDGFIVTRYSDSGGSSNPLQDLGPRDRRHSMFTNRDSAAQISHWREREREAVQKYNETRTCSENLRTQLSRIDQELRGVQAGAQRAATEFTKARRKRDELQQEVNADISLDVAGLEEALAELEDKLRRTADQFEPIIRRQDAVALEITNFTHELDKVKEAVSDFDLHKTKAREDVMNAGEERTRAMRDLEYWESKLAEEKLKLQGCKQGVEGLREELGNDIAEATNRCARVDTSREPRFIEREIAAMERALDARERRGAASVEDVQAEVDRTRAALHTLTQDLADLDALTKILQKCVQRRKVRWMRFRAHMAFRCKNLFQDHLASRGYSGFLELDHENHALILKVRTERNASTQDDQVQARDTRALSGGEKSFTTTCLLLAM